MENQTIKLNNGYVFVFNDEKEWIWKAIPPVPLAKPIKMKEKPFIKLVEDIEASYKKEFEEALFTAVKDTTRYLV